jgi:hypothetical protein
MFMGHKDYKTINVWLKDLREKEYVTWIYSTDFIEKTKPGIYYLGLNGIRWLKQSQDHPTEELRKRYRESSRSRRFIDRCVLLADCCITLEKRNAKTKDSGKSNVHYSYVTEADYADPDSDYHFLTESELVQPNLCFVKEAETPDDAITTNYLLEVFDATMPRYRVRKRLKNYIEYLDSNDWQSDTDEDEPTPIALFVCATKADLIYCKRATKRLLEDVWDDEDIHMRFAIAEKLKQHGVTEKIWEEA